MSVLGIKERWNRVPLMAKASIAYAVCSILQRCMSFVTVPIFTRLLTTEQYGQYVVYQSWSGILSILLTLNLAYGSFSTAMIKFEDDRKGYISSVEGISITLSVLFLIIYLPVRSLWNGLFELPTCLILLMIAEILGMTAIQLWSGKNRFEYKYKMVVLLTILMSVLSPSIAYVCVINSSEKGIARIFGYSIVTVIFGAFFFVWNAKEGKKVFCKEYWKYALGFNVPLLAYYFSQVIFNQSDRIMISHMIGKDKAAVYGVAYTLAMILTFVLSAINNSYVPWFYGKIKEGKQEENKVVSLYIAGIMAVLLLGVIWFAPEMIMILGGKEYIEAVYVVPPVALSLLLLFYSQLFINVEFFYEERGKLVWASISAALVNLVLNWIFIGRFGFVAAAYTTLISYILFVVGNYCTMKQLLKEKKQEDKSYDYKGLLLILGGFIVVSVIGTMLFSWLWIRMIIAALVLIIILLSRKSLIRVYKEYKVKNN